ncbi:sigma-70 family RNA polymerase sigma factor [Streptomyces carpaticus]|uniref:Sigma-70 family RNA polymerase sigma factor n=1 Tax=Streptomyces carpaticus TaxID=285558 RepID=A0ABV4ZP37_9ACTN
MDRHEDLAARFEEHRPRLRAMARRMLGSAAEAEDAVQEVWLRAARAGAAEVENLGGWLTTITGRVCLNLLRSRGSRPEEPLPEGYERAAPHTAGPAAGPEEAALLADSVGAALVVVLETLSPAERLAFVLHDMFAVPYEEIAPIVGRGEAATRQLASRARRRVRGADPGTGSGAADAGRREVVRAFLAAAREGDLAGLVAVLHPDVVLRSDDGSEVRGAARLARGASAFAAAYGGGRPALVDGRLAAVTRSGGGPVAVAFFTVEGGRITAMDTVGDPVRLAAMEMRLLED